MILSANFTSQYGRIAHIDLKVPPRPPGYAFVEVCPELAKLDAFAVSFFHVLFNNCLLQFEDARDAEDAIRGRDGYDFDGHRLRVGNFFFFFLNLFYVYSWGAGNLIRGGRSQNR